MIKGSAALALRHSHHAFLPPTIHRALCAILLPPFLTSALRTPTTTYSTSSSSTRWKARQTRDTFAREARVAGLKSRAAFKLLEIDARHRLFRRGDTVVDLGYAPGSWSQVAVAKTTPGLGRVVGIDLIPAQPPRGANALQGNFLNPEVQAMLREFVRDEGRGRVKSGTGTGGVVEATVEELEVDAQAVLGVERKASVDEEPVNEDGESEEEAVGKLTRKQLDEREGRVVDVVLSDMMMNTSGMAFRDHAGSMDLCLAALTFCYDTLRTGGHFLCKYYTGSEDHAFEMRLKKLFEKVHRIKPDSSRKESKEAYFLALRRRPTVERDDVLMEQG